MTSVEIREAGSLWTPDEDVVLLQHVAKYGTRHWSSLKARGILPHRDQKACCNRFLLLKRKFLHSRSKHLSSRQDSMISLTKRSQNGIHLEVNCPKRARGSYTDITSVNFNNDISSLPREADSFHEVPVRGRQHDRDLLVPTISNVISSGFTVDRDLGEEKTFELTASHFGLCNIPDSKFRAPNTVPSQQQCIFSVFNSPDKILEDFASAPIRAMFGTSAFEPQEHSECAKSIISGDIPHTNEDLFEVLRQYLP